MLFTDLEQLVRQRIVDVLKTKGKDVSVPSFDFVIPPSKVPGDVATNVALMLAKSVGESPRKLAEEILKELPKNSLIEKTDIAGAGFLNVWVSDVGYQNQLEELLAPGARQQENKVLKEKILIEFVSANPTGPLHIGHGRGAALGDSLVRIFRALGHEVTAEFYINDSGGQIRNLGMTMEARVRELKGEPANIPESGYKGKYVVDLAQEAIDSGKKFNPIKDNQMVFDESDLAGFASKRILKMIQASLLNFDVHFDTWYAESELHKKNAVPRLFEEMKKKNLSYEQDGALWFRATDFGDEKDRVLQKANEAPTYFASDLAYHEEKYQRGFDKLVNIWGADHHGYSQRVKGALKALGFEEDKLHVVLNQLVSIKGGRLSKRAGDMIWLHEVLEEVGKDATRFFFALRSPGAHFEFDLDLAKKQASDNPVFYVQYVHARCCSIMIEAEKRGYKIDRLSWKKTGLPRPLEQAEKSVLLHLSSFNKTLEQCAFDYSNHHLTVYLLELAGKYHTFYEKCRVLDDEPSIRAFRLDLVEAIRRRVAEGLNLLGVSAPERL